MGILQSSPQLGSPDRGLCEKGLVTRVSAVVTLLGVEMGTVLTLSLERRPPRPVQSNLPVSPLEAELGSSLSPEWTGQAETLTANTEVDSVPRISRAPASPSPAGIGAGVVGWLPSCLSDWVKATAMCSGFPDYSVFVKHNVPALGQAGHRQAYHCPGPPPPPCPKSSHFPVGLVAGREQLCVYIITWQ